MIASAKENPSNFNYKRDNLSQTVVIENHRIRAVGPVRTVPIPLNAHVIRARGKFLIPGLWDMHVHTVTKGSFLPLYVANGVTGVRDTANDLDMLLRWRSEIDSGRLVGPQMIISGPLVDGPHTVIQGTSIIVESAAAARNTVIELDSRGADFIKVYNFLSLECFDAIVAEARKRNMHVIGHVPLSISAGHAARLGLKSIEHLTGTLLSCSSKESEIREMMRRRIRETSYSAKTVNRLLFSAPPEELVDTYDEAKAQALFAEFVRYGTWHVPTLTVLHALAIREKLDLTQDSRFRYMPSFIQDDWSKPAFGNRTPQQIAGRKRLFEKEKELVAAMHRSGVKIMAGTDTPNLVFPGFGLHDELGHLVDAGLTPAQALKAATHNPAEFLGLLASHGSVEAGKIADLVLLNENPLEDIRNTRAIEAVVLRGRLFLKFALREMLERAATAASSKTEDPDGD